MSRAFIALTAAAIIFVSPRAARAQEDNHVALGVNFTTRASDSRATHTSGGVGISWRFGHSETGWGIATGLGWYAADIDLTVGGTTTEVGELHVRPFMAGYGYTYSFGRAAVSAELLGGFAIVSFRQAPSAADVYRDRLGARSLDLRASNTFMLRPQSNLWIDAGDKFGVNVTVAYAVARPKMVTSSSLGEASQRLRADVFSVSAGLVYKIF